MVIMALDELRTKTQREPRRQMNKRPAWFTRDDGVTRIECYVLDVSPGGAKIMTDAEIEVGDRIRLALVPAHQKLQPCEVVWRRGNTCGIKFVL
jgi:hypothetical protein